MLSIIILVMENIKLNWENCSENLLNNLKTLWSDNCFNDVTLVFDDESQLNVNRTLLAALSPHLRSILNKVQGYRPWLYMFGIESSLVKSLLDFVFFGEINIEKDKLEGFVKIANKFQIDGFTFEGQQTDHYGKNEEYLKDQEEIIDLINEYKTTVKSENKNIDKELIIDLINEYKTTVKSEDKNIDKELTENSLLNESNSFPTSMTVNSINQEHDSQIHTDYKTGTKYSCNKCERKFKTHLWLKQHERKAHAVLSETDLTCDICYRQFKTISKIEKHKVYSHPIPGKLYKCNLCPKESLTKNASNVHYHQFHTAEERKGQML